MFKRKFKIEFFPRTGKYFVKYRGGYLKKNDLTGLVSEGDFMLKNIMQWATSSTTEREAEDLIELYKEQHFKNLRKTSWRK